MKWTLATSRPIVRRNLAIWRACIHIVIFTRRADLEVPCWVESLECLECSGIPFLRIWSRSLGVTDIHRHVVCPNRHLAWNNRSLDRDLRTRDLVRSISPKVSYRLIQYGLEASTQLVIALRKRRSLEERKKQERKYQDNAFEHGKLRSRIKLSDVEAEEGLSQHLKPACSPYTLSTIQRQSRKSVAQLSLCEKDALFLY